MGNVLETCIATEFPRSEDALQEFPRSEDAQQELPKRVPSKLRAMRTKIVMLAHSIDVIYQICRGNSVDKTGALVDKHWLNMEHIMPMAFSTELFAAVLVALTRIQHVQPGSLTPYDALFSA